MQIDKKTIRNIFLGVLSCIVLYWVLSDAERAAALGKWAWKLISPFVVGAAIAFVFNVPMRSVERQLMVIKQLGLRRACSIILTVVLFCLIVAFVVVLLVPQIQKTAESLAARLPDFINREAEHIMQFLDTHPQVKEWVLDQTNLETIDWASLLEKIIALIGDGASKVFDKTASAISSVTSGIVNAFVSVVFAVYAVARKEVLARQGRRLMYSLLPEKTGDEIVRVARLTNTTFSNFISGQCLEAIILGCLFAVAMLIFKMPYIPLVSVIIAVTALIPLVGAFIGCFLGALFILVESPIQAFTYVVMFLVIHQIEGNLMYPRVVGTSIGLPGMWVLAALTIGGELMGVGGMLIMIPLASVMYALMREFTQRRVAERGIDPEKLMDHPPELKSQFKEHREKKRKAKLTEKMKTLAEKHTANGKKK